MKEQEFLNALDSMHPAYKSALLPTIQLITSFENHYGVAPVTPNDVTVDLSPRRRVNADSDVNTIRERLITRLDEGDLRVDFVDALMQAVESGQIAERALWRAVDQAEQDWRDGNVRRKWCSLKSWFNGVQNGTFEAPSKRTVQKWEKEKKLHRAAMAFAERG